MPDLRFIALPTGPVRALQAGGLDANGQPPERQVSDGSGVPCRHCLTEVQAGEAFLVLAHRPFPAPQPYAEIGPIFLHADACARYGDLAQAPPMFLDWEKLLIRGYGHDDRIVYGTGRVVPTAELAAQAAAVLERPEIAYVHVRSASNNCYQCRVERA
ncbi:MAG TPA: DUF1203 domain-containing protein [Alphaproteobacteria bacterium]|nr:DUF1203 domain-containing protein [Alphaproteobacteria bacterium]